MKIGCIGKKAYTSYRHATHDAQQIRARYDGDSERVNVYRCRLCQHWHVGNARERPQKRVERRTKAWHWREAASE
jgi:hypothetical protein